MREGVPALRLQEAWRQCQRHLHHLQHALNAVKLTLPMTALAVQTLSDESVQDCDQLILRFTKLQDTMGGRLFPATLDVLQEPLEDRPMIDKLHRLERLGYLSSLEEWNRLRSVRNRFTHDYPEDDDLKAAFLNEAAAAVDALAELLGRFKKLATSTSPSTLGE